MPKASIGITRNHQVTYGNQCHLNYCTNRRLVNHRYCQLHKYRLLYRGDANQILLRPRAINFSRKTVKLLVIENQSNPAWNELIEALHDRWEASRRYVQSELDKYYKGGQAQVRGTRKGHEMCADIFQNLGFDQVLEIWAAFQYLQNSSPLMFASDEAFRHQVIKYLRAQAKSYHSQTIDKRTGKPRSYSSVLYMTERETCWDILLKTFGAIGLRLDQQLQKRAERLRANKEKIDRAIRNIN